MTMDDASPTARALMALELIQNSPDITAGRLARRLAVSERAVRRYISILREADLPVESTRGPYGGYRVGRGHRVPPLMFTTDEALGLVMAVLEGHHAADDPTDPAGSALAKIIRVLPPPAAEPATAVRNVQARAMDPKAGRPNPQTTALLVQACAASRRLRIDYRLESGSERTMDVDPWSVVMHHGRWYLLCWSHAKDARRLLRVDRVLAVEIRVETFIPPADFDPVRTLEEHVSEGWRQRVEVVIDAPAEVVAQWIPRSVGRVEEQGQERSLLIGSTHDPDWFAQQLTVLEAPFRIIEPNEVREAAVQLGRRLQQAGDR